MLLNAFDEWIQVCLYIETISLELIRCSCTCKWTLDEVGRQQRSPSLVQEKGLGTAEVLWSHKTQRTISRDPPGRHGERERETEAGILTSQWIPLGLWASSPRVPRVWRRETEKGETDWGPEEGAEADEKETKSRAQEKEDPQAWWRRGEFIAQLSTYDLLC